MSIIDIYTDGGCHTRSGVGGWAAMVYEGSRPIEISGHETGTTNQRMELRAATYRDDLQQDHLLVSGFDLKGHH